MFGPPMEKNSALRHTVLMEKMIEIPKELIEEANRFGLNEKAVARSFLLRAAKTLAAAESVTLFPVAGPVDSKPATARRRS